MCNVDQLREKLLNGAYSPVFEKLYGREAARMPARYAEATSAFGELFGKSREVRLFSAPGRTEIGGNHTDHQRGCVLAAGVNLDVIAVASPNADNVIRLKSKGYDMDTVQLDVLPPRQEEEGTSAALIRGVCAGFHSRGLRFGGFDAYTTSDVLKGSGLSSSAAFEVLVATILSYLYNDGSIGPVPCAQVSQYAENVYFGKPSGLMDQMASAVGGFVGIDFKDLENPVIEKVDFDFSAAEHTLCIVDTGGSHADLTHEYAAIPADMKTVAAYFGKQVLREVEETSFWSSIPQIREACGDRACLRAMHFFEDNRRAILEKKALQKGDFAGFLNIVNDSGRSSLMKLQNIFAASDPQEQSVTVALAMASRLLQGRGACRVHGGGFAGTIQAFVPNDILESFRDGIEAVTGKNTCYMLSIRSLGGVEI